VTVSRKVGGSVVRNRIRRMVREAFRTHRDEWFRTPTDLVVIAKQQRESTGEPGFAGSRMQQVAEELGHALQRSRGRSPRDGDGS
jgi:ribonuclease P protein component